MTEDQKQALRLELLRMFSAPCKPMQDCLSDVEKAYEFVTREREIQSEQQKQAHKAASYNPNPFPEQGE